MILAESSVTHFVDKQRLVDTAYKCHLCIEENLRGNVTVQCFSLQCMSFLWSCLAKYKQSTPKRDCSFYQE